jgi:type VI secretion system protein ImpE
MASIAAAAEQALREGDAKRALESLLPLVRSQPGDARLRIFLFQLLAVLGQWQRALDQLAVVGELDAAALPMVQTYREAIACELLRREVFAGRRAPLLFGEPETWVALLIEALLREGRGEAAAGRRLRDEALEQAPASPGMLGDDTRFEWVADADLRLGPTLEVIVNGRYYWLPWSRIARVDVEPPVDLRDAVWMPVRLAFTNGGEAVGLVPTRYPDTELAAGDALALARRTEWRESPAGLMLGLGQRIVATDDGEVALMDLRSVVLDPVAGAAGAPAGAAA